MSELCFFDPIKTSIIDTVIMDRHGIYRGMYGGKTLAETAAEYNTKIELWNTDEAWKAHQESFLTEPVEITKERFWDMLEVLPPCRWVREGSSESFHMSEHDSGNVTLILVRIAGRYFEYHGYANTRHTERVAACYPLFKAAEEFEK